MALHFNPKTCSFHDDALGAPPAEAIEVTRERHAELFDGQARGGVIYAKPDGTPSVKFANTSIDKRRLHAVMTIKGEAARRIEIVSPLWRQLNDMRDLPMSQGWRRQDIERRFATIDRLRAASDQLEMSLHAMTANQLAHFRASADQHWTAEEAKS